jgi:uncharacterized repeat protein (TIGR01451 family)/CSLREA domain-containing protein
MFTNLTNLWRKIRGPRSMSASKRPRASRKSRRLFLEPLENRSLLATITVTTTVDDLTPNDKSVSLREAITAVNAGNDLGDPDITQQNPGTFGVNDTINFSITGSGVQTIHVGADASAAGIGLPPISKRVTINGYSQPGSSANANTTNQGGSTAVLLIELDGSGAVSSSDGLTINAGNSVVRGLVINRFQHAGIVLHSSSNVVAGNFIGTSAAGNADLGNGTDGVSIIDDFNGTVVDASSNTIGGTAPEDRNLISGNDSTGVLILANGSANLPAIHDNKVQGNLIGTDKAGTAKIGNTTGVRLESVFGRPVSDNLIGGTTAAERNVISANPNGNVFFVATINGLSRTEMNRVQGNFIGTDVTGAVGLANGGGAAGVTLGTGTTNNFIGGTGSGEGNVVAFNPGAGVEVDGGPGSAIILANSIFSNGGVGIDLGFDGVTQNDEATFPFDIDTGPNNLQNFPDLTSVTSTAGTTTIQGTLKSIANTTFRIEFFASTAADPSGFGEGYTFLGSKDVTTNATGDAPFTFTAPTPTGNVFTATATRTNGEGVLIETSEFSEAFTVAAPAPQADVQVTKSATSNSAVAGADLTYTITLTNAGPGDAQSVSLSDALPAGTTFVSVTQTSGPSFSLTKPSVGSVGTFSGSAATIGAGATASFTLVVHVNASTPDDTTLNNTAIVASTTPDTNTVNNSSTESTGVSAQADLQVTKSASASSVAAGGNLTYTITVTNAGPSDAQGVSISDALPPGTTFVSFAAPAGFTPATPAVNGTGTVTASATTLAVGQTASFQLVVRIGSTVPGGTIVTNTAQASTATADTNLANNSAPAIVQVEKPVTATGLTITLVGRQAKYRNEFGLYIVDDASGRIGNLRPGDAGYARAALSRAKVVFAANTKIGTTRTVQLPEGSFYGLYLIQNANTAQFLARNPSNRLGLKPLMFFSFRAANPDGLEHVRRLSVTRFGFEDLTFGGDRDFNDLIVDIRPQTASVARRRS